MSENLNERAVLSSLKELIAAGDHSLDPMLGTITDVARQLTGASGAALAMWKEGAMVCRARTGELAPILGAQLSVKAGISGECLRTGKIQHCADTENDPLVDLEVCRSLGLRSIAVLPIRGWRGINGILEVFSTKPAAFTEQHIALLQQLAVLAERARTSQPESALSAAPKLPSEIEKPPSGVPPASDRVGDGAQASRLTRSRPFVLGAVGLVAIALLALAIWLGWRGPERADGKATAVPASASPANVTTANVDAATSDAAIGHAPDGDTVWKANPGGESVYLSLLSPSNEKPSAGSPVKFASKVDAVTGKKTQADRAEVDRSLSSGGVAADVVVKYGLPNSQNGSKTGSDSDSRSQLHSDAPPSVEPLSIPESVAGQSPLNGVLTAKASLPGLGVPVSRGVSGGQLVHRVPPVYPAQARVLRLEGRVVLAAVIMEDGTLRDVRVVEGEPLLAQSAVDAVQHWRYKPYELDGKPVKNLIRINVDFKFPESSH
ncbi:MAG TPA: TonB family protein [Terriglobales bacterium]|jgi:TonB family protein|nr:TonB family protein [Terriglobales bacterium]